jgi:5'-nucleotidase
LATGIVPALAAMPAPTVLNLNVPAVPLDELLGLRHGSLGTVGLIRSVRPENMPDPVPGTPIDRTGGAITLTLRGMGAAADRVAEQAELEPDSDAALIAAGWATLTPLIGVHEDLSDRGERALASALATFAPEPAGPR